jgi:hypothetical protein
MCYCLNLKVYSADNVIASTTGVSVLGLMDEHVAVAAYYSSIHSMHCHQVCTHTCAHVSQMHASLKRASATARIQPDRAARGVLASYSALSEGTHLYVAVPPAVVKVNGLAAAVGSVGGCGRPPTYASLLIVFIVIVVIVVSAV